MMRSAPALTMKLSISMVFALVAGVWLSAAAAAASTPQQTKNDAIVVMNAHLQTFHLGGKDRTGYDPYAYAFAGKDKIQTESTAMALYYGGVENLGLSATQLQAIYDYFVYMMDSDDWLYSDYTVSAGLEYKKSLHTAWSLIALDILEAHGIPDTDNLKGRTRDALEAAIDANGYMSGDPNSNESIRTKFVQSLPFLLKVAQDAGDAGAIDAARRAIDFYMANCIDGNYDLWKVNASGSKTSKLVSHEMGEFAHGLYLFHQYETDSARKADIQSNLEGILQRYTGPAWSYTNSYGEKYISNAAASGNVNTLAQFQIQFVLALAAREGWVSSSLAAEYLPIIDRIKMTGFGDPELDNNYYYQVHPDTGAAISGNINSYLPGYVIFAMDVQGMEIAGRVLDDGAAPVAGASLSADNGGGSATTDSNGDYILAVPYDWSGSVTPSRADFSFAPGSRSYANVRAGRAGEDYSGLYSPDVTAPAPDPMTFAVAPTAVSSSSITMTATTASDPSAPVEYLFACTNDGSKSSSWQTSTSYVATGLLASTQYTFNVTARDSAVAQTQTAASVNASATTLDQAQEVAIEGTWTNGLSHAAEAGSNRALIFTAHHQDNQSGGSYLTGVSYGGRVLAQIDESEYYTDPYHYYVTAWVLDEAGIAGASDSTFSVTWSDGGPSNTPGYSSQFLSNVDQANPIGAFATANCDCSILSTSALANNEGDLVMLAATHGGNSASSTDYEALNGFTEVLEFYSPPNSAEGLTGYKLATGASEIPSVDGKSNNYSNRQSLIGFVVQVATATEACGNGVLEGAEQCDDGNTANGDCCDSACNYEAVGTSCDDGDACTATDSCDGAGICNAGGPLSCDDGNGCTDDSCDPGSGCVFTDNTVACDDGSACTTGDVCSGGVCVAGAPLNVDDGNVCTDDSCNPATGAVHTENAASCDDSDACTTADTCFAGVCVGGSPLNVDDGNVCTDDSCDPATGAVHANNTASCDDGSVCTTSDSCAGGACVGSAPLNVDDGNGCTDDSCDPATGAVHSNNTASCDDGNACTESDSCAGGACVGGSPLNVDDSNVCTDDSCDPGTGAVHANNTASCDDGSVCTTSDSCAGGACVGSAPLNVDDGNGCTDDSCDPDTGAVHANNTASCDDGSVCTTSDSCAGGACVGSAPLNVDDGNGCTDDSCDPMTGAIHTNNTASCDDGDACTAGDVCGGGTCNSGAPVSCQQYVCSDGLDNDGDDLIDYPADPECTSPSTGREVGDPLPATADFTGMGDGIVSEILLNDLRVDGVDAAGNPANLVLTSASDEFGGIGVEGGLDDGCVDGGEEIRFDFDPDRVWNLSYRMHQISVAQPEELFTPYLLTIWDPNQNTIFSGNLQQIGTVDVSALVGGVAIGGFSIQPDATGNLMRISQLSYDVDYRLVDVLQLVSIAAEDGYLRESSESSEVGNLIRANNSGGASIRIGDQSKRKQWKSVVSFDTSVLPVDAEITRATLDLTRGSTKGDPLATLGGVYLDVQTGGFGASPALEESDFEASATAPRAAQLTVDAVSAFGGLDATGIAAINDSGVTQMRVYFEFGDDGDSSQDQLGFYSGDSSNANQRPVLELEYEHWAP